MLMIERPQIQVAFGLAGEIFEKSAFADDGDDGQVDRIVPVFHGFVFGDVAFEIQPHKIAVNGVCAPDACETVRDVYLDVRIGRSLSKPVRSRKSTFEPRISRSSGLISGVMFTRVAHSRTSASMNSCPCSRATETR